MSPRGIARNIGSRAPGLLSSGVSAGSRPLGDESEPVVRLLACAYQVISKRLGDSRSSGKPGVPAAAAPAAPFTRLHKRAAWPDRIESTRPRSVSSATISGRPTRIAASGFGAIAVGAG